MSCRYPVLCFFSVLACTEPQPDSDSGSAPVDSGQPGAETGEETGDPIAWDRDQDGYIDGDDCNDYDDEVYPGAPESWNAVDDDCNGRIDADGSYSGKLSLDGQVIIEGVAHGFSVVCPTTLLRASATMELQVVCESEEEDTIEFIGEQLILDASDTGLSGANWSGRGELSSSQGWATSIVEVEIEWIDFEEADVRLSMDSSTASLSLSASGTLEVEESGS